MNEFGSKFDRGAGKWICLGENAPAQPIPGLEYDDRKAGFAQLGGSRKSRHPGTHNNDGFALFHSMPPNEEIRFSGGRLLFARRLILVDLGQGIIIQSIQRLG